MKTISVVVIVTALLCTGTAVRADVFNLGAGLTNLETVFVGDPGNTGQVSGGSTGGYGPDRICGSVGYDFRIGKYEVTAAQYCEFLNHKAASDPNGLYNEMMSDTTYFGCNIKRSGEDGSYSYSVAAEWANKPVNFVSFWDGCRFANWLENGQGNGDTETGSYTLDGYANADGNWIQRNAGAKWAIASEDEWYKAAYYKGAGSQSGYWDYPTRSNLISTNMANYGNMSRGTTVVGAYGCPSAYGTYDQGGNVWEWNEASLPGLADNVFRGSRGGRFGGLSEYLKASYSAGSEPSWEDIGIGFRVVQLVPEPASLFALVVGIVGLGLRTRNR